MLSMIRYDAAAGHVVLVECHHLFSAFNDSGCTTVRSGVVRLVGGVKIYIFLTSRYLVLMLLWIG